MKDQHVLIYSKPLPPPAPNHRQSVDWKIKCGIQENRTSTPAPSTTALLSVDKLQEPHPFCSNSQTTASSLGIRTSSEIGFIGSSRWLPLGCLKVGETVRPWNASRGSTCFQNRVPLSSRCSKPKLFYYFSYKRLNQGG